MQEYILSPTFKSHLENLYFFAGVLVAAGLVIGICQLRQQRQLSKIANRREAFRIAAEQCERYGRVILPEHIRLLQLFTEQGVRILEYCKVEITDDTIKLDSSKLEDDELGINRCSEDITRILNSIEAFSLFFASGIADDNAGFLTCGRSFVELFEENFPLYALSGSLEHHNKSTQILYARWKERIRQMDLLAKKREIDEKIDLSKLRAKRPYGG